MRLIDAFKTAVSLSDGLAYIDASKRQVEILYRNGILKPLVPSTSRGSVRHEVFGRDHLDDLLERLGRLPKLPLPNPPEHHPIAYACQHGAGPFGELFAGGLSGESGIWRHPEKVGIRCVYVEAKTVVRKNARV
ncbi:hypothetical protein [Roseicyclus mahoneyensis]|nr:hypothetical protein [Roseicyclus mahoneyensis]